MPEVVTVGAADGHGPKLQEHSITSDDIPIQGRKQVGNLVANDGVVEVRGPVVVKYRLGVQHLGVGEFGADKDTRYFEGRERYVAFWVKDPSFAILGLGNVREILDALKKNFPSALPGEIGVAHSWGLPKLERALLKFGLDSRGMRSHDSYDFLIEINPPKFSVSVLAPLSHPEVYGERWR